MGITSYVGSCIKNTADRLRALLTITQVLTRSTEEANDSSRSSSNMPPLVEDHATVPVVDSVAAIDVSLGTLDRRTASPRHMSARIDMVSLLRSYTDDGNVVRPTALSDRMFWNACIILLIILVSNTIQGSTGSVQGHRGIRHIEWLPNFVSQVLRGGASSSRTTDTGSTVVGDGGRHNQDHKMKEFRKFAYWITALFIAILLGLISANKRQPGPLFRSCRSLVIGGAICCIAMLMLTLILPSSQRALTCLKLMQYLTVGLLFVATILVFTLL